MFDHITIRASDREASERFYGTVAPHADFRLRRETPERAQFVGESGSFTVVLGEPTEHLHVAFRAHDRALSHTP